MSFFTYMLRCADGSYYVGQTDDLDMRLRQHDRGEGSRYTSKRLPLELVWCDGFATRDLAKRTERTLKGWSRKKKEASIAGKFDELPELARAGWQRKAEK